MSPVTTPTTSPRRRSILVRLSAGAATVATVTLATVALWPASNAEKAHADGEQLGEAVAAVEAADTQEELDAAMEDLDVAVEETADNAGDAVYDEAVEFDDAADRAVDGFVGMNTTDDGFEYDLYEAELDGAIDDLNDQASDLEEGIPEVQEEFWQGYEEGYNGTT